MSETAVISHQPLQWRRESDYLEEVQSASRNSSTSSQGSKNSVSTPKHLRKVSLSSPFKKQQGSNGLKVVGIGMRPAKASSRIDPKQQPDPSTVQINRPRLTLPDNIQLVGVSIAPPQKKGEDKAAATAAASALETSLPSIGVVTALKFEQSKPSNLVVQGKEAYIPPTEEERPQGPIDMSWQGRLRRFLIKALTCTGSDYTDNHGARFE